MVACVCMHNRCTLIIAYICPQHTHTPNAYSNMLALNRPAQWKREILFEKKLKTRRRKANRQHAFAPFPFGLCAWNNILANIFSLVVPPINHTSRLGTGTGEGKSFHIGPDRIQIGPSHDDDDRRRLGAHAINCFPSRINKQFKPVLLITDGGD